MSLSILPNPFACILPDFRTGSRAAASQTNIERLLIEGPSI